jgi:hypothetical protein
MSCKFRGITSAIAGTFTRAHKLDLLRPSLLHVASLSNYRSDPSHSLGRPLHERASRLWGEPQVDLHGSTRGRAFRRPVPGSDLCRQTSDRGREADSLSSTMPSFFRLSLQKRLECYCASLRPKWEPRALNRCQRALSHPGARADVMRAVVRVQGGRPQNGNQGKDVQARTRQRTRRQ